MTEMLTAKEMQDLLQVDRSTVYRMAEAGQLPAIKVGKQWRFPGELVDNWFKSQTAGPLPPVPPAAPAASSIDLASSLPLDCVQLIQDAFAEALGITLAITDLAGQPVTQISRPCPVYTLLSGVLPGRALYQQHWQELGRLPALEPRFIPDPTGLLSARALVRFGPELKGMVVVLGMTPPNWSPVPAEVSRLAQSLGLAPDRLQEAFEDVVPVNPEEQKRILVTAQRIADILAHIGAERAALLGRLDSIARLSVV